MNMEVHVGDDTVGRASVQVDSQPDSNRNYILGLDYHDGNHDYNVYDFKTGTVKNKDYTLNGRVTVDVAFRKKASNKINLPRCSNLSDTISPNEPFHTVS